MTDWEHELQTAFPGRKVEDLSDFDRTQNKAFYVSLSDFDGDFGGEEFADFSDRNHVFYMVVNISEDEKLAYLDFLKYVKGSKGQNLIVSEEPFLLEHEIIRSGVQNFLESRGLKLLAYEDLLKLKNADPMFFSKEVHYAGDYVVEYKVLGAEDEKNPHLLEELRRLFKQYEKHIGIDLQFQGFARELAELPGAYASPDGAIIIAQVVDADAPAPAEASLYGQFSFTAELAAIGCVALRPISNPTGRIPPDNNPAKPDSICEMKRLYVDHAYGGLDIGSELARRIINEARKKGYKYMRLDTLATMEKAQKLYESLGFYDIEPYIYNPIPGARFMELEL